MVTGSKRAIAAWQHRGKRLLRRLRTAPPVVGSLRPQHPGAFVRVEFRRHPEAVAQRVLNFKIDWVMVSGRQF